MIHVHNMKRYTSAWINSLFGGWLVATTFYFISSSIQYGLPEKERIFNVLAFAVYVFAFSLIGNLIFVFPFRRQVENLIFITSKIVFALILSAYGLSIFVPVLSIMNADFSNLSDQLLTASAALNGFTYGLIFYSYRKPIA